MRILMLAPADNVHTRRWATYIRDSGREVHIATFLPYEIPGVTVHRLPTYHLGKAGYFVSIPNLRQLYRRIQPDIVNAHYVISYGFLSAAAGLRPLVVTGWGSDVLLAPRESALMRLLARYALKKADAITIVAEHMKAAVFDLGIDRSDIHVIPFGVDTALFKLSPAAQPTRGPVQLICTRNFKPIYDVVTLIQAVSLLKKKNTAMKVILIGDGPQRVELEAMVARLNLARDVTFLGFVDHARLADYLANSEIFVTPALSDGHNVSLTEAMACGCFPIATDIPANRQWLTHGENGYLYPAGDATALADMIARAIKSSSLREEARAVNRQIVRERANWQRSVHMMDALFLSLLNK